MMFSSINFELVPIQFAHITSDIINSVTTNAFKDTTQLWLWIILLVITSSFYIRHKIISLLVGETAHILAASIPPFIAMTISVIALATAPNDTCLTVLHGSMSFWLAISLLRIPLVILGLSRGSSFYATILFFALSAAVLLYTQLAEIASYNLFSGAVSLFTLLSFISKIGIMLGLYLYGYRLMPTFLNQLSNHWKWINPLLVRLAIRFMFIAIAITWIGGYITLSSKVLMILFIATILIAVFIMIKNRIEGIIAHLYNFEHYSLGEIDQITYNLKKTVFLTFIVLFIKLGLLFDEGERVQEALQNIALIKTSLWKLSLWQLGSVILSFNLWYSSLVVIVKSFRRMPSFRESITVKSLEALSLNIGILVITIFTLIQTDISWQVFVPIAGALGIGIGFGLQTILNNYMSGFIILYAKKLRIGDIVELPGDAGTTVGNKSTTIVGTVEEIDVLSTTLKTTDGIEVSIPNSFFISEKIINYTQTSPLVRVRIPLGVAYDTDLELTERLIIEALEESAEVEQSMPKGVFFTQYGTSSIDLAPYFWINMRSTHGLVYVKSDLMARILGKLRAHNITIPFPQSEITIKYPVHIHQHSDDIVENSTETNQ